MTRPNYYVSSEDYWGEPFTLEALEIANVDSPLEPHDVRRLAELKWGEHLTLGGGATAEITITRIF